MDLQISVVKFTDQRFELGITNLRRIGSSFGTGQASSAAVPVREMHVPDFRAFSHRDQIDGLCVPQAGTAAGEVWCR